MNISQLNELSAFAFIASNFPVRVRFRSTNFYQQTKHLNNNFKYNWEKQMGYSRQQIKVESSNVFVSERPNLSQPLVLLLYLHEKNIYNRF